MCSYINCVKNLNTLNIVYCLLHVIKVWTAQYFRETPYPILYSHIEFTVVQIICSGSEIESKVYFLMEHSVYF